MKKKFLLSLVLLLATGIYAQTVVPFKQRFNSTQKGNITFAANSIITCNDLLCATTLLELPPYSGLVSQNDDHTAGYIDIDLNLSTFSSSFDEIFLPACSEVIFAELYWGGSADAGDARYAGRENVKLSLNHDSYVDITADTLIDNTTGYDSYHCRADVTHILTGMTDHSEFFVGNVYAHNVGYNNFGGWNLVIVYRNESSQLRNLVVYDGLAAIQSGEDLVTTVNGFTTPDAGAVDFDLGVFAYDGDRALTGDQLLFDGGSGFENIYNFRNPLNDVFNFSITNDNVVSLSQVPLLNNTLSIDADIFRPDNSSFDYIGNGATSADIKITSSTELILCQVLTLAMDVSEPDLQVDLEVVDIDGGDVLPGDTLLYNLRAYNIGTETSLNSFVTDSLPANLIYVPGSLEIIYGPNLGGKTDLEDDDQAEYDDINKMITVRIGTAADDIDGGEVLSSPTGLDSTVVQYKVVVTENCITLSCYPSADNIAEISGDGALSSTTFSNYSTPNDYTYHGSCKKYGHTSLDIDASGCVLPADTVVDVYCSNIVFSDFRFEGYTYYDDTNTEVTEADAIGDYYAVNAVNLSCADTILISVVDFVVGPTNANAGSDQTVCSDPGTATMAGNDPTEGTGTWSLISGTGTITDVNVYNTTISDLSLGDNVFEWSIENGTCPEASVDYVTITVDEAPTTATAGSDQELCITTLSTSLDGNEATVGSGIWSIVSGSGTIDSPTDFDSDFDDLAAGDNVLQWEITNGVCPASNAEVTITVYAEPTVADAGSDQTICTDPGSTYAEGNEDVIGTGTWSIITGTGTIEDANDFESQITAIGIGTNTFRWTIENGSCTATSDDVNITVDREATIADAGADQELCITDLTTVLEGNTPLIGSGNWTITDGGGAIVLPGVPTATYSSLTVGENTLEWAITNGVCPPSTDEVLITVYDSPSVADAGDNITICSVPGSGTLDATEPAIGTGVWAVVSGTVTFDDATVYNTAFTDAGIGVNVISWTVSNGPCTSSADNVTITVDEAASIADAGIDQDLCQVTTTSFDAESPVTGTGTWTLISGTGIIADPLANNAIVTGLSFGPNVFRWTVSNGTCADSFDEMTIVVSVDSDADGVCDRDDLDSDNDGIPDIIEGDADSDGDGIMDAADLDSDNDGTPDLIEAGGAIYDADKDGRIDAFVDLDADGIHDPLLLTPLSMPDSDGDGVLDLLDLDSDNDGTSDLGEAGGLDVDLDGRVDLFIDIDIDGFADLYDTNNDLIPGPLDGGTPLTRPDTDGDLVHNGLDLDSDNDGIPDLVENLQIDADGDGRIDGFADVDGDGYDDAFDTNNDLILGPLDGGAGLIAVDSDIDGIINSLDLDSDNDGLLDVVEAGGVDVDGNGRQDGFADTDENGLDDALDTDAGGTALLLFDTDGTGNANFADIDSDGDGIPDNVEVQPSASFVFALNIDADLDGIDDAYDADMGGIIILTYDFDGDLTPDFMDLDTDNDGENDDIEAFDMDGDGISDISPLGTDLDGDGLDDAYDLLTLSALTAYSNSGNGTVNPLLDGVFADFATPGFGDLDFREGLIDSDADGIADLADIDSDNDGITDSMEGDGDADNDGVPNRKDLDSDNDGIPDIIEAGGVDVDGNGKVDDFLDLDGDGLHDALADTPYPYYDTDGEGLINVYDVDSDNDGIYDLAEESGIDINNDGTVDTWTDNDFDGIPNYADVDFTGGLDTNTDGIDDDMQSGSDSDRDGIANDFDNDANGDGWDDVYRSSGDEDTDGDGVSDYLDLDSDNDGIPDIVEDGGMDINGDGVIDDFIDLDENGGDDDDMTDGLKDFDEDGSPDHEDLDADNDGISDIIESGGTDSNDDGLIDDLVDEDGNGWDDNNGNSDPRDTDGDGQPDFTDNDSDNDSVPDSIENDSNNDGSGQDDTDGDGVPDYMDNDDDGDGLPTVGESDINADGSYSDCDGDGISDYLDADPCSTVFVPTGFSPNGDGMNDYFEMLGTSGRTVNLTVFNRWGSIVFKSDDYQNDWDGSNQSGNGSADNKLPVGTYYYVVDLGEGTDIIKNYLYIEH